MNSSSPVQSIDRVFSIIEFLSHNPQGISLSQICTHTNLPKGTASRMLSALIQLGYAFQDVNSKKYCLTMKMFDVGSRVIGAQNILSVSKPYLDRLAESVHEAVHLVSRVGDEVVYIYKEEASSSIVRMASCVGLHNPMYCTGVGKSILAFLDDREISEIWSRTNIIRFTENTITEFDDLMAEISKIRENGYALDNQEHEANVRCVAAPIFQMNATPIAAISISASAENLTDDVIMQYIPLLKETSKNISRYYGSK